MIKAILDVFGVIKQIIALIHLFLDYQEKLRQKEKQEKAERLEKAVEDLKNAKTEEEIWDAQRRIADNKP